MTRLNFPYFMNETAVKYIIEAVKMVAREGWKLLPQVCLITPHMYSIYMHIGRWLIPVLLHPHNMHRLVTSYINRTHIMLQMPSIVLWLLHTNVRLLCIALHCLGCLKACMFAYTNLRH